MAVPSNTARRRGGVAGVVALALVVTSLAAAPSAWAVPGPTLLVKTNGNDVNAAVGRNSLVWARGGVSQPSYDIVVQRHDGSRFVVNPHGTAGFPGGLRGNALVFQQIEQRRRTVQSNLWWINLKTGDRRGLGAPVNTGDWEWRATVSGPWILFGREGEPNSEVWLFNTQTRELKRLAVANLFQGGEMIAGQVSGNYAVWTRLTQNGNDVFRYDIATGATTKLPRPSGVLSQYAASVTPEGTVYYGRSENGGCGDHVKLVRQPLSGPSVVIAALPNGADFGKTYAFEPRAGTIRIVFGMNRGCDVNADVYQFVDHGQTTTAVMHVPAGVAVTNPQARLQLPDRM